MLFLALKHATVSGGAAETGSAPALQIDCHSTIDILYRPLPSSLFEPEDGSITTDSSVQVIAITISSSSAMKPSDHDSSERGASTLPNETPSVTDSGGTDSGYGLQSSTPGQPNSAYVNTGSVVSGSRLWPLQRKITKLKPFDKPIPQLTQNRFEDLRELHADNLNKLTRGLPRCQGILMSLKVLGESEREAEPWVFVQCDKAVARKVRSFFKQPTVKSEFQPAHPDSYSPHFKIYVCELPPKPLVRNHESSAQPLKDTVATGSIEVYAHKYVVCSSTLCGTEIKVSVHGKNRTATIGGLVKVLTERGETLFGITAGHFLTQEQYEDRECQDEIFESSDDLEDYFSDEEEAFELDLSSLKTDPRIGEVEIVGKSEQIPESWPKIGRIYKASHDGPQDRPNLDWALIAVENQSLHLPDIIHKVAPLSSPRLLDSERGAFVLISAISSQLSRPPLGTLSRSWSYLMLAPGEVLVRTYLLTFSDNKGKNLL
jgi:hypothetical protein